MPNRIVNCPLCGNALELYSTRLGYLPGFKVGDGKRYSCDKCGAQVHVEPTEKTRQFTMKG